MDENPYKSPEEKSDLPAPQQSHRPPARVPFTVWSNQKVVLVAWAPY